MRRPRDDVGRNQETIGSDILAVLKMLLMSVLYVISSSFTDERWSGPGR